MGAVLRAPRVLTLHILLTDILACPRCGPEFGLIVLADRLVDRHVEGGVLGCANCRASYPVEDGTVDLRVAGQAALDPAPGPEALTPDEGVRMAALVGAQPPGAWVVVIEGAGVIAGALTELLAGARIVSITPGPPPTASEPIPGGEGGLNRVVAGMRLPFRSGFVRAAAVAGSGSRELLAEAGRILAPGGRLVVVEGGEDVAGTLLELGFTVHLQQPETVVAAAPGPR